jgi:hypothetical protein
MRGWQTIDTAPKDGTVILTWCATGSVDERPVVLAWRMVNDGRWDDDSGDSYQEYDPTHWTPIPEPPK